MHRSKRTLQARILEKARIYMALGVFYLGCYWLRKTSSQGRGEAGYSLTRRYSRLSLTSELDAPTRSMRTSALAGQVPAPKALRAPNKKPRHKDEVFVWWGKLDSDQRSQWQQIYSLPPLAAREFPQIYGAGDRSRTNNLLITNQLLCHWATPASPNALYYSRYNFICQYLFEKIFSVLRKTI